MRFFGTDFCPPCVPRSGATKHRRRPLPMSIEDARLITLPKISDPRGNLTFIEGARHVPFEIRRTYYLYDVPGGASRGGHAHLNLQEFIIAASGSFTVVLNDGANSERYFLNRSHYGLYV